MEFEVKTEDELQHYTGSLLHSNNVDKCWTKYSDVMEEVGHFLCDNVSHIKTLKKNETFRSSE